MEEQKNKKIKMNPGRTQEQEKLTYEQLNNACVQLSQENQYLKQQLSKASSMLNACNRLDYLFKVVEISKTEGRYAFSSDFIENCIAEIQDIMTIPEEEDKDEE